MRDFLNAGEGAEDPYDDIRVSSRVRIETREEDEDELAGR